jgi:hypothetical protein
MAIDIAGGGHFSPFDRRIPGLHLFGQAARRFGDDLKAASDAVDPEPVL